MSLLNHSPHGSTTKKHSFHGARYAVAPSIRFNFRLVIKLIGITTLMMGVISLLPVAVALVRGEACVAKLALSTATMLTLGGALCLASRRDTGNQLYGKESFWITTLVWIVVPLAGSLPYLFTGSITNFTDAAFESFSGFTTTGASVIDLSREHSHSILLWRSLTGWVGGLGLLMLIVPMLPQLRANAAKLYDAEYSGSTQRRLHPHLSMSVTLMWRMYLLLTVTLVVLLLLCGNDLFMSACVAMSTTSTGGFLPTSGGIADLTESSHWVLSLFMLLSGINIAILYQTVTRQEKHPFKFEEFRTYLMLFAIIVAVGLLPSRSNNTAFFDLLRQSVFRASSAISTCGMATDSHAEWGHLLIVLIALTTFTGAMSGSTGGGLKIKRILLLLHYVRNYFVKMLHPNAVKVVLYDGDVVEEDYLSKIFAFLFLYLVFVVGGALVLCACGEDIVTSLYVSLANIGNVGCTPTIGQIDPSFCYSTLPTVAKWGLIVLMTAGRIEIFALIAIVSPAYWRRH